MLLRYEEIHVTDILNEILKSFLLIMGKWNMVVGTKAYTVWNEIPGTPVSPWNDMVCLQKRISSTVFTLIPCFLFDDSRP
jgi:hypothetical protein